MLLIKTLPQIQIIEKDPNTTKDKFTIQLSNLELSDGVEHISTSWIIEDAKSNKVVEVLKNTEYKTKYHLPKDLLCIGKEYEVIVFLELKYNGETYAVELTHLPFIATPNIAKNCDKIYPQNYVEVLQERAESAEDVSNELLSEKVAYTIYVTLDTIKNS